MIYRVIFAIAILSAILIPVILNLCQQRREEAGHTLEIEPPQPWPRV
jgi:hypothetical protein